MTKVQLTLTDQEVNAIHNIGARYGYSLARTLKFIVSRETSKIIDDSYLPTFVMNKTTEKHAILKKPSDIGLL